MGMHKALLAKPIDRAAIEAAVAELIDVLDMLDGDSDLEETDAEDSFALSWIARGIAADPGCSIADAGEDEDPAEDADEDECQAGDDGCGAVLRHGKLHFGSQEEFTYPTLPIYGEDQTRGPLNEVEAERSHLRSLYR